MAITPDGFILTSTHVVAGARRVSASFVDGRELDAEVVGADSLSDLAVIRARGGDLVPAALGDASRLRVGQLVVAIGSPLGFEGSVTAGVVSGLGRSLVTRFGSASRLMKRDPDRCRAAPRELGGALADGRGEVVGINTAVVGPSFGQGLGLAVPINAATRRLIGALIAEGRVRRAYLGVAGGPRPLPPRAVASTGRSSGIEVLEVVPGSPASLAGLRSGDLIVSRRGGRGRHGGPAAGHGPGRDRPCVRDRGLSRWGAAEGPDRARGTRSVARQLGGCADRGGHTVMTIFPWACPSPRYRSASGLTQRVGRSMTGVTSRPRELLQDRQVLPVPFARNGRSLWLTNGDSSRALSAGPSPIQRPADPPMTTRVPCG